MREYKHPRAEFDAKVASATEIDWARLAVLIDGEGSIVIAKSKPNPKFYLRNPQYQLVVSVFNTSLVLMDWLMETFAGHAFPGTRANPLGKKKNWHWVIQEDRAATILRRCLPYFIIKRQQAETGLAFRKLKKLNTGRRTTPAWSLELREKYRNEMRTLNGSLTEDQQATVQ